MIRKLTEAFGPSIFSVEGELNLRSGADLLTEVWASRVAGKSCIVIDLSGVTEMEPEMARVLLELRSFLKTQACRLVLLDASRPACRCLEAARDKHAA